MRITPFATFESSFPDDSVEDGGDIVVPAGANILRALFNGLAAHGYHVSNFDQHSHYGWSFDLRGKAGRFWLLIQNPGPWLLTVHDSRWVWQRLGKGRTAHAAFIEECHACLTSIPQITAISWMTRQEYEARQPTMSQPNSN